MVRREVLRRNWKETSPLSQIVRHCQHQPTLLAAPVGFPALAILPKLSASAVVHVAAGICRRITYQSEPISLSGRSQSETHTHPESRKKKQSMSSATAAASAFLDWFVSQGGLVSPSVEIVDYGHGMGRGAQATSSIQADEQLFAIPRDLVLSTSTASLPAKLSTEQWSALANQGWCGLILCMQYEASLGPQSRWHPYFQLLPTHFDSLMHWSDSELQELQGSMVLDKIGKEAAEADYRETVLPLLRQRPDLFGSDVTDYSSPFSLQKYHTMGSLILSRSFNVDPSGGDVNAEASGQGEEAQGGASAQDSQGDVSMEGPSNASQQNEHADEDEDDDDDDEEEEEESGAAHVAMVPFADILNAKSGANNAELSYEAVCLV